MVTLLVQAAVLTVARIAVIKVARPWVRSPLAQEGRRSQGDLPSRYML